jgi:hypothetical protein
MKEDVCVCVCVCVTVCVCVYSNLIYMYTRLVEESPYLA